MPLNKKVEIYLDKYCDLGCPSYAVLLKGQWGCGKSHFISAYQQKSDKKFIYISLYGLKEVAQIDDALFQATNPRFGSKGMGVASKIIASSLKSTVKVDVSSSSTYLKKLLSKTKDSILIFDDLERCNIPLKQVFGYINDFVEHEKRHVIIIADASKVEENEYLSIKEKLIGQELEIQLDIKEAFKSFCTSVQNEICNSFLSKSYPHIYSIYKASGYNNLRTLRKVIQDFEYMFETMPAEAHHKNDLLQDVLNILLALSLEVRSGNIKEQDIVALFKTRISARVKQEDSSNPLVEFRKKYSFPYSPILGEELWQNFFETGILDKEELGEAVLNSSYFSDDNTPDWMKLWHAIGATDEEFESRKKKVLESLLNSLYKEEPVIIHVFGLFLWMSKKGIDKNTSKQVLQKFIGYVDELVQENSLIFFGDSGTYDSEEHFSLAYFSREEKEFQDFIHYLNQKKQANKEGNFPVQGKELMNIMKSDTRLFEQILVLSNSDAQKYFNIPILKYIEPVRFMDALDKSKDQRIVTSAFERRYEFQYLKKDLIDELPWLEEVKVLLEEEVKNRKGKISGWRYKNLIEVIDSAIGKLRVGDDSIA